MSSAARRGWLNCSTTASRAAAAARATALAAGPTAAYRLAKQALRASAGNDLPAQLALEARLQAEAAATADFAEGVAAFLAKRP